MGEVWYRVDYSCTVYITPVKARRSSERTIVLEDGYKAHIESLVRRYFSDFDDAATFANERIGVKRRLAEQEIVRVERNETELWVSIQRIRDAIKDGVI